MLLAIYPQALSQKPALITASAHVRNNTTALGSRTAPTASAHIYVATTGNDSTGDGSQSNPYATITQAASVAVSGTSTVIHVAAGSYAGSINTTVNGTSGNLITYYSTTLYGAKIIASGGNSSAWKNDGAYTVIDGFEVDGSASTVWRMGIYITGSNSTVQNCHVHNVGAWIPSTNTNGGAGILADAFFNGLNFTIQRNIVHDIGPAVSDYVHGIYMSSTGDVKNNLIYNCTKNGITGWHNDRSNNYLYNTIINCQFGIAYGGGDYYTTTPAFSGPADNVVVANNIIVNCSVQGINQSGSVGTSCVTTNNLVWNCPTRYALLVGSYSNDVNADPLFTSPINFHLRSTSPAINAASSTYTDSLDLDYNSRPFGSAYDLGCYEYTSSVLPLVLSFDENELTYSNTFRNAAWSVSTGTSFSISKDVYGAFPMDYAYNGGAVSFFEMLTPSTSSVTMNYAYGGDAIAVSAFTDPTGGSNALQVNSLGWFRQSLSGIDPSEIYTVSIWVKTAQFGSATSFRITTSDTSGWNTGWSTVYHLSSTWTRITYTGKLNSTYSTNAYVYFGAVDATGATDSTCIGNVLIYQAQINQGRFPARETITTSAAQSRINAGMREQHNIEGVPVIVDTSTKKYRTITLYEWAVTGTGSNTSGYNPTYLINRVSSAKAVQAYSLRKINGNYAGNCITVRRSSDSTTSNIGFTASGDLDTASLLSFCGSGDGFITTWYDQSGNGYNLTQATSANQPKIVSSGSLLTLGGSAQSRPAIKTISASSMFLIISSSPTLIQPYFINNVLSIQTIKFCDLWSNSSGSSPVQYITSSTGGMSMYTAGEIIYIPTVATNIIYRSMQAWNGATSRASYNNNSYMSSSMGTTALPGLTLGGGLDGYCDATFAEFIIFSSEPNTTDKKIIDDSQRYYWS